MPRAVKRAEELGRPQRRAGLETARWKQLMSLPLYGKMVFLDFAGSRMLTNEGGLVRGRVCASASRASAGGRARVGQLEKLKYSTFYSIISTSRLRAFA